MSIAENLDKLKSELGRKVKLVAVSKFQSQKSILEAYHAGQRVFGENKVQEMLQKYNTLPKDIQWHLIGHLQTNKVKLIAPFVQLIHSVDSLKLLQVINAEAQNNDRIIECLLQIKIAREESKYGLSKVDARNLLAHDSLKSLSNISITGLMGMATYTDDENVILSEFSSLHDFFMQVKNEFFLNKPAFKELSIGMSGDYQKALKSGSTMVRIGSKIFGERNYNQL